MTVALPCSIIISLDLFSGGMGLALLSEPGVLIVPPQPVSIRRYTHRVSAEGQRKVDGRSGECQFQFHGRFLTNDLPISTRDFSEIGVKGPGR